MRYLSISLILYCIIQSTIIITITWIGNILWIAPIYLGILFYTTCRDLFYEEERIFLT